MNETIQKKHDLIRAYENNEIETEEYKLQLTELINKEKQELKERLCEINEKVAIKEIEIKKVPKNVDKKCARELYRELIELYRSAEETFLATRKLKKDMRDLM